MSDVTFTPSGNVGQETLQDVLAAMYDPVTFDTEPPIGTVLLGYERDLYLDGRPSGPDKEPIVFRRIENGEWYSATAWECRWPWKDVALHGPFVVLWPRPLWQAAQE